MFFKKFDITVILSAFFLTSFILLCYASFADNNYLVEYNKETDRLTLTANNISLKKVLEDVASKSSLTVFFDPGAEKQVTLKLKNIELDKGIKRLVRFNNCAMVYEKVPYSDGSQKLRLKKVSVFKVSEKDAIELTVSKIDNEPRRRMSTVTSTEKIYGGPNLSHAEKKALSKEERKALKKERSMARRERAKERREKRMLNKNSH